MNAFFIVLQYLLPQHLLSRLTGHLAECRVVWLKNFLIRTFIAKYGVNMNEAMQESPEHYDNFNHFFKDFKEIVVNELLDNFKLCADQLHSTNKTRYNDSTAVNFESARQILLS